MSVSTVFSHDAPRSTVLPSSRGRFVAAAVALSFLTSACGTVLSPSVTPLPSLSESELLRQDLIASESAVAARAHELAVKSSTCVQCSEVAQSISDNAQSRVEALGGVWQPWPSDLPQSALVERPWPAPEAPLLPAEFAAWMSATAYEDLQRVLHSSVSAEERPAALASSASRLVAAQRLASAFGFDIDEALVAKFRSEVESSLPDEVDEWRSWDVSASRADSPQSEAVSEDSPQSMLAQSGESEALARALSAWDCAAQALPAAGLAADRVDFANTSANALLTRVSMVSNAFETDTRPIRCVTSGESLPAIASNVLRSDLMLLTTSEHELQDWAEDALLSDIETWGAFLDDMAVFQIASFDQPQSA